MKIGIYGFGSVGMALYNELRGYHDLYVLSDEKRKQKYEASHFRINGKYIYPKFISHGFMDVIFIALKNYDLKDALEGIRPFLKGNTLLIPLCNGITAHDVIKEKYPEFRVLYGIINVEANKTGEEAMVGKILNLQYGDRYNFPVRRDVIELKKILDFYHVNNHIYQNMERRVWLKWMLNLGINQISALLNASYKDMRDPYIQEVFPILFKEVYQVSLYYHIGITEDDIKETLEYCRNFTSDRVTSLTLDMNKKGKNELSSFGETFLRLAEKAGIPVPANLTLYSLLRLKDLKEEQR